MNVLITGCSRGIGLGLVKQFLERTNAFVIATARNPEDSSELQELKRQYDESRLITPTLDIQKPEHFSDLKNFLCQRGINSIDVLIGNAGISNATHPHNPFMECTKEDMLEVYETNVVGNMLLLQTFHDMLLRGVPKIAAIMSSSLGSYTNAAEKAEGTTVAYRCSKAALNMLSVLYADEPSARDAGIKVLILHPGWVKTDMGQVGGQPAKLEIDESTQGILEILERAIHYQTSHVKGGEEGANVSNVTQSYEFKVPPEEIENKDKLNEFISPLESNNFAFVSYDGSILQW